MNVLGLCVVPSSRAPAVLLLIYPLASSSVNVIANAMLYAIPLANGAAQNSIFASFSLLILAKIATRSLWNMVYTVLC